MCGFYSFIYFIFSYHAAFSFHLCNMFGFARVYYQNRFTFCNNALISRSGLLLMILSLRLSILEHNFLCSLHCSFCLTVLLGWRQEHFMVIPTGPKIWRLKEEGVKVFLNCLKLVSYLLNIFQALLYVVCAVWKNYWEKWSMLLKRWATGMSKLSLKKLDLN